MRTHLLLDTGMTICSLSHLAHVAYRRYGKKALKGAAAAMEDPDKLKIDEIAVTAKDVDEEVLDDQNDGESANSTPAATPASTARTESKPANGISVEAVTLPLEAKASTLKRSNLKLSMKWKKTDKKNAVIDIDQPMDAEAGLMPLDQDPTGKDADAAEEKPKKKRKKEKKDKPKKKKLLLRMAEFISAFGVKFKILISLYQVLTGLGIGACFSRWSPKDYLSYGTAQSRISPSRLAPCCAQSSIFHTPTTILRCSTASTPSTSTCLRSSQLTVFLEASTSCTPSSSKLLVQWR